LRARYWQQKSVLIPIVVPELHVSCVSEVAGESLVEHLKPTAGYSQPMLSSPTHAESVQFVMQQ
jgi:hypothetical protein